MIVNAGYMTGINGSVGDHIIKSGRFVFSDTERISETVGLVEQHRPDILFIAETRGTMHSEISELFAVNHVDRKYGPQSPLHLVPFFSGNSNGIFMQETFPVRKIFLKNGTKKLVYRIEVAGISVFFIHLALGRDTRKKQLAELSEMMRAAPASILAGDFNLFGGSEELEETLAATGLQATGGGEYTFPSFRPQHTIDHFLISSSIRASNIKVLHTARISDHLPVIMDFEHKE